MSFPSTRAEALERWDAFLEGAASYARRRNGVEPGHPHVSRLSPAVRLRLVTEDELSELALERYPFTRIEKLLQEIDWRRYWKGWLELRPQVWTAWTRGVAELEASASPELMARAKAVAAGESGVAVMDTFARELLDTGYMHNHARMWWASFWIHVEKLPWELGAAHFYRQLLDADPASNTLSWRWVAGLQTPGKTYLVRRSNLEKHCSPEIIADARGLERVESGAYEAAALHEHLDRAPRAWRALPSRPESLPQRFGLWVHGDDLAPEHSELRSLRPVAVAAFLAEGLTGRFGLSAKRARHLEEGLGDGIARAAAHYGTRAELLQGAELAAGLARWAESERLEAVVAHAPFVGPLGEEVPALRAALERVGARLVLCRRETDERLLPLARSGFFGFWKKAQQRFQA